MPIEPLPQEAWQQLTTWSAGAPSLADTWALLTDAALPESFVAAVKASTHQRVRQLRQAASSAGTGAGMEARGWNIRFANLVSGRFTEVLFHRVYGPQLESVGVRITETTGEHDWLDYLLVKADEAFTLGINVKNAGVQFRAAEERVGLAPDDTLPIATYKIFGSTAKEGHVRLVYVYLVDWDLISRLRSAYWDALNEGERVVFRLMTSFKGVPRKLEDRFIESTVGDRLAQLCRGVGYADDALNDLPFRAVSGRRCQRIFYLNHGRAPYVYVQRMNTDPNVHVSVSTETLPFGVFIERWLSDLARRAELLAGLDRTESMEIPDPPV